MVTLCTAVGITSGFATASGVNDWYVHVNKPFFNPPNWLFAPVWTVLYTMIGISGALVWHKGWHRGDVKQALSAFAIQMLLNGLWSILFFGLQMPGIALIEILLMWYMIYVTIKWFYPISKWAAYLLVPYLMWVSFATILNASIWWLN